MFDFAEKLYPYENIRGNDPEINEDARRKQIAKASNFGATSMNTL